MQTIQSFFAPAPYGTPWKASQIKLIQIKQTTGIKPYADLKKYKLAEKRVARLQAIEALKKQFSTDNFTNKQIRKFLNFDRIQVNNLICYMINKKIIVKVDKSPSTSGFIYKFAN